jgi:hypothetical protein
MNISLRFFLFLAGLSSCTLAGEAPATYKKSHTLQGIAFTVTCPNKGSLNKLVLTVSGLKGKNTPITVEVDGTVTGSEVADLNADGAPEIYIFTTSAGSGSYAGLVAYSSNNKKSLSPIHLPELSEDQTNSGGYMGHDQFTVIENRLARRFPLYGKGDANAKPTGKTRQLQYKLKAGEAGWLLRIEKSTES